MTGAQPQSPSILVSGLAKTGTTGAYDTVRSAVPDGSYAFVFEPRSPEPLLSLGRYAPERPVLTKIMVEHVNRWAPRYEDFDRRIMTVRDPRDTAISRLLFRPMAGNTPLRIDESTLEPFLDALREKEADPSSHSVKALHELADRLGIGSSPWAGVVNQMQKQQRMIIDQDFFVLHYEDFVDGRLDAASDYLGLSLAGKQTTDDGWKNHISRSLKHGEWRRWFLDEDIEYFGNMFGEYMERFGYTDWEREADPTIDPSTSSDYVVGKAVKRIHERQNLHHTQWTVSSVETHDDLRQIESMARDGRAVWAYRAARVYEENPLFSPNREQAIAWARHGATLGNTSAMDLLARFLRERVSVDREALIEARFWEREQELLSGTQRLTAAPKSRQREAAQTEQLSAELKRTQQKLRKLRSSARYRLGSAIADVVSDPRNQALPAAKEVGRLARSWLAKQRNQRRTS